MNKYLIGGGAVLALAVAYYAGTHSSAPLPQQQFNSNIVLEKQRCQDAFAKWSAENTKSDAAGIDMAINAHFNQNLNACLVSYLFNNTIAHSQVSKVIDIYDNKTLLELDIEMPGAATPVGEYLAENGNAVHVWGDAAKEYDKRKAALFEEVLQ